MRWLLAVLSHVFSNLATLLFIVSRRPVPHGDVLLQLIEVALFGIALLLLHAAIRRAYVKSPVPWEN